MSPMTCGPNVRFTQKHNSYLLMKFLILITCTLGFSQVTWQYENIDLDTIGFYNFKWNSISLDNQDHPRVVYNDSGLTKVYYAYRTDSGWIKEIICQGLYMCYGFSMATDNQNIPHVTFSCAYDDSGNTYICHAFRETGNWSLDTIDMFIGTTGYWYELFHSCALDTVDLPGIAYLYRDLLDTLWFIKYAHYNGSGWNTEIVTCDSNFHRLFPLDWSPSLIYTNDNTPYIAFYRVYGIGADTIKLAHLDSLTSQWIIEPVISNPYGGLPISLRLNSQDHPCIAHGYNAGVAYSWWDGVIWHTEGPGISIGWNGTRIGLDIDNTDNPHIIYLPDPVTGYVGYCNKHNNEWHDYGRIDSTVRTEDSDVSLILDGNNEPRVCYAFGDYQNIGLRYARGTLVGIEESRSVKLGETSNFTIYPNPARGIVNIKCKISATSNFELALYNTAGIRVRLLGHEKFELGEYQERIDLTNLPSGIYFIVLKQYEKKEYHKFLHIK